MSKMNFPSNPSAGAEYKWRNRRKFNYDNTRGGWTASGGTFESGAPALNANTSIEDFNDATGLSARLRGQAKVYETYSDLPAQADGIGFAFVKDTNKLYYWDAPGKIGRFQVGPPSVIYRISYDGGTTWIYHQGAVYQNTLMQNQAWSGYPSQYTGIYPSDIGEYAITTGNQISDDPTTARYVTWTAPATTTYTITVTQASSTAYNQSNAQYSAPKLTYKWNVTVPTGGKLYVSGGQSASKYWGTQSNTNQEQYNRNVPLPGGTSQILLYDPGVTTGTLLNDGNRVNCILSIPGTSGNSSTVATNIVGTTSIGINTTNGEYRVDTQGHNNQPVGQVHIATYGGYPKTTNFNVYYHTNYITPVLDFENAEPGTNYIIGSPTTSHRGGSGGTFVIEDGLVAD